MYISVKVYGEKIDWMIQQSYCLLREFNIYNLKNLVI